MLFRSKTTQSESLHSWHSPIHKNIHTLMIKAVASFWGFYLLRTVHPIYFIFTKLTLQQWLGDRDLNSSHSKNTYNTHTHTYKQQQTFVDRLNLQYNSYWNFYATLRHLSCIFHSSFSPGCTKLWGISFHICWFILAKLDSACQPSTAGFNISIIASHLMAFNNDTLMLSSA